MYREPVLKLGLIMAAALILCAVFSISGVGAEDREEEDITARAVSESAAEEETPDTGEGGSEPETFSRETEAETETETETGSGEAPGNPVPGALYTPEGLTTDSDAYCVIDENGQVILSKNADQAFAPASITKVLTALVVLEHASPDDRVVVREEDILSVDIMSSGVYPSLKSGEVFTVRELLYALILPSTNAAGAVLASHVAGDQESFAALMNEKLAELGLSHSHFVNAHGLDAEGHYVSAYDMCVILKAACENAELLEILSASSFTIPATDYTGARSMVMGHRMVTGEDYLEGVFAGKPGGSVEAGSSLLTAVSRDGITLYVCTLHTDEGKQYEDTRNLIGSAYACLAGTRSQPAVLVHDLRIASVSGLTVTFSFRADNSPASVTLRAVDPAAGDGSAVYTEVPVSGDGSYTGSVTVSYEGTWELQVYATGSEGELTAISARFLANGAENGYGMFSWNGQTYFGKENGFLYTGAVEVPGGFYYANADGGLASGFVGGKFYAGADFSIVTGWFTDSYETYYAGADGRIVTGKCMIGGNIYEFNDYGALIQ